MNQSGAPTVEEILASIKQVIARDSGEGAFEPRRREPLGRDCPARDEEDDVLDLAEAQIEEEPLLTEGARAGMRDSLAALAAISGPGAAPPFIRSGETSLEGLAREMLRPALAEWLDRNLPAMVEKLVAAEIAKIVGKKG